MEKIEMTDLERDLVELIGARRGAGNAISRKHLCEMLDYVGERRIRAAINNLIIRHGVRIASGPEGYYTPVTTAEVDRACQYLHNYAIDCLMRESRLRKCALPEILEQLKMEFEENAELVGARSSVPVRSSE